MTAPATEPCCLPPHFGMVYLYETGCARHAVLYPYDYRAWEARSLEQVADEGMASGLPALQPPLLFGKAPFKFFGLNARETRCHARCWWSSVLHREVALGSLEKVQLMLGNEDDLNEVVCSGKKSFPAWLWECYLPGMEAPVEVSMLFLANKGVQIVVSEGPGDTELHQLLCKYCDVASSWHPVPEGRGKAVSPAKTVFTHDVLDDRVSGWVSRFSRMETLRENLTREELLQCVEEACEALIELLAGGHEHRLDLASILGRNIDAVVCHYLDAGEYNELRDILLKLQETTSKAGVELPALARKIILEGR
mmetsp:Transcript_64396/g.119735  ORF Transcript_64396/g.119735 Transcript_64396/m.119735 type:complete len:309 (-) Transcript_64396:125-1051(-)